MKCWCKGTNIILRLFEVYDTIACLLPWPSQLVWDRVPSQTEQGTSTKKLLQSPCLAIRNSAASLLSTSSDSTHSANKKAASFQGITEVYQKIRLNCTLEDYSTRYERPPLPRAMFILEDGSFLNLCYRANKKIRPLFTWSPAAGLASGAPPSYDEGASILHPIPDKTTPSPCRPPLTPQHNMILLESSI